MPTISRSLVALPPPSPRRWATALTTYRPLPQDDFAEGNAQRWLAGVSFAPFGCLTPTGSAMPDICIPDAVPDEDTLTYPEACVEFAPFLIQTTISNQVTSGAPTSEVQSFARAYATLARSTILGREAMFGLLAPSNESFVDAADTVGGTSTTAAKALAAVEDALAVKLYGGEGMIHVTPGMLTQLASVGAVHMDGDTVRTFTGNAVVADAGYTNAAPSTGVVTAGQSWIYGSGPVFYRMTEAMVLGEPWESFDYTRDTAQLMIEQYAIIAFEPCAVVAARADL